MSVVLYSMSASPPCRIASLALDVLGVEYEFKKIDLMKGEARTPEYLKVVHMKYSRCTASECVSKERAKSPPTLRRNHLCLSRISKSFDDF